MMTKMVPISEFMTSPIATLTTEDTLDSVKEIFDELHIHHMPITDQKGKVVGMISKSDLDKVSYGVSLFKVKDAKGYNEALFRSLRTVEVMTKDVICLSADAPLADAFQLFHQNKFHAIPIVEDGLPIGILSTFDLLEKVYHILSSK